MILHELLEQEREFKERDRRDRDGLVERLMEVVERVEQSLGLESSLVNPLT